MFFTCRETWGLFSPEAILLLRREGRARSGGPGGRRWEKDPPQDVTVILRFSGLVEKYTGQLPPIKAYLVSVLPFLAAGRRQVQVKLALHWGRGEWLLVKLVLGLISSSSTLLSSSSSDKYAGCLAISIHSQPL